MKNQMLRVMNSTVLAVALATVVSMSPTVLHAGPGATPCASANVLPPWSSPFGHSYGEWSAAFWQWFMEHPMTGHPGIDSPAFDVRSGQSGKVWFLAPPFGTVERTVHIPSGKALFVALANAEASSLEGSATGADQRATATWTAAHIVSVSCSVDRTSVRNIAAYRVQSPQFSFTAPDPWIFSPAPGGEGTSVADGYYVMLTPFSRGAHTIQLTGAFHFAIAEGDPFDGDFSFDVTYHVISN
jgi:hypothetical protein